MAAQAGQVFPLTALFQLLNVDGKERILPVLEQVEATTAQMQQLAQENEQLRGQVQQLNETLDGYASIVSSSPGSQDALQAMGGGASQAQPM
jgi:cell division protein FtsB